MTEMSDLCYLRKPGLHVKRYILHQTVSTIASVMAMKTDKIVRLSQSRVCVFHDKHGIYVHVNAAVIQ